MPSECSFKGCGRPAVGRGLCASHFRQRKRAEAAGEPNRPLRPLRGPRGQIGAEPLVQLPSMKGPRRVADAMREDKRGAVDALMRWTDSRSEQGRAEAVRRDTDGAMDALEKWAKKED